MSNYSDVITRFIKYVKIDTQSAPDQESVPSTQKQFDLAHVLVDEMKALGLEDVRIDDHCYVYGTLPATTDKDVSPIGFVAHMDTAPDYSGKDVNPQFIHYDGGILTLSDDVTMTPEEFPELNDVIGEELITTDGTTLLGADNKAGIAEIMSAVAYLAEHPEIPHGPVRVGFTPDEEVGRGADYFDVKGFDAAFAYTVDGGPVGELEYESFNAASTTVQVKGNSIHPGSAKNKMVNAQLLAMEFFNMLPVQERPEYTEGYEGFYLLHGMEGSVEEATLSFIIRDHDRETFEAKKKYMDDCVAFLNKKYGDRFIIEHKDSYYNMGEIIEKNYAIVELAQQAMETLDIPVNIVPIRGGTDGSRLSFMGLPTPNIFTGGYYYHGKYEMIPVSAMKTARDVIIEIIKQHAEQ